MAENIVDIGFSYKEAVEQARKDIEAELNSINTKIDLSDSFKDMESGIKKSLNSLNTELNKLSSKKINTSNYNNFKNSVSGHFTALEKKVVAFQNKLDSLQVGINTSKLTTQFDTLKQSIENSNAALEKLISNSNKAGIKTVADKAKTKVTSSAEKDSIKTVQVHTELNTQVDTLQAQLDSILSKLQKYADSKPIKASVKITGATDEQTKNALKQTESLSKAFNTSSGNIVASANQEVIALNTVVSKVRELQRSLNQIKNIQLPKLDINSITSDNSKSTKNSVSKELNAINRAAENSEKLSELAIALNDISTQLVVIDKCINVPDIFAGLKISKSNVDNIEKLSGAFDKIKVSLDGLSEGGFNFLQELGNISKQAENLKNLATILKESKGRSKSPKLTDEEKYQNRLNSRVNSLQNSFKGQDLTEYDSKLSANALESYRSRISNSTTMDELNAIDKELDKINTNFSRAKKLKGDLLNGDFSNKKAANDFIEKYASNNGLTQLSLKENIAQDKNISQWIAQFKTAKGEIQNVTFTYDSLLKKMSQQTKTVTPNVNNLAQAFSKVKSRLADIVTYWTAMYLNPYQIIGTIKQGINLVRNLDNALLDLKKTTTMPKSDLASFYKDANKEAKKLGVNTKQIIEQASSWSRLGYSDKQSATEMAQLSSQFKEISPGMDLEQAQSGLVSMMKAFDVDVSNVKKDIMDNVNDLGNKFALSNKDIVDGMSKSSAAMSAMGQSLKDTMALFVGGQEILQDADSMGSAMRAIAMRVRGYDEETQQLSEDLVNVRGKVADLTKTASNPNGISLFTDADQKHYKSMVEYLGEIADIWDDISEKNQTELLQLLFAKTRAQAGASIIKNFDQVRNALKVMEDSAGSADREMGVVMETLDYKANKLKETWTGFAQSQLTQENLGNIIEFLNKASEGLTGILNLLTNITSIGGHISGLGGQLGVLGGTWLNSMGVGIFQHDSEANKIHWVNLFKSQAYAQGKDFFKNYVKNNDGVPFQEHASKAMQYGNYDNFINNLNLTDGALKDFMNNDAFKEKSWANFQIHLKNTGKSAGALTKTLKSVGSAALNMFAGMAIGVGIDLVVTGLNKWIHAAEDARKASKELTEEWKDENQSIEESKQKYDTLYQKLHDSSISADEYKKTKEELIAVQDSLKEKYGEEAKWLDLINGKYDDQIDKLDGIQQKKASDYIATNGKNIEKTKQFLDETIFSSVHLTDGDKFNKIFEKYGATIHRNSETGKAVRASIEGTRESNVEALNSIYAEILQEYGNNDENAKYILDQIVKLKNAKSRGSGLELDANEIEENVKTRLNYSKALMVSLPNASKDYDHYKTSAENYNATIRSYLNGTATSNDVEIAAQAVDKYSQSLNDLVQNNSDLKPAIDEVTKSIDEQSKQAYIIQENLKNGSDEIQALREKLKGASKDDLLKINFNDQETQKYEDVVKDLLSALDIGEDKIDLIGDALIRVGDISGTVSNQLSNVFNVDTFNSAIDEIQSSYNIINAALEEYNQYGAYSLDTMQAILSLKPEYLEMLSIENGQIIFNQQAMQELIETQVEEAKAKIFETGISELNALAAKKAGDATWDSSLKRIDSVTNIDKETAALKNNSAAAFENAIVKAQAAGVSEDEINGIRENVEKQVAVLENMVNGMSFDFGGSVGGFGKGASTGADDVDKASDALDNYNKKVKDINKSLSDLDKEEHLSELKYTIEQIAVDLDRFKNTLDSLDSKLDLTFENDFPEKLSIVNEQLSNATKYGGEMRSEIERLMSIQPQTGDEAEELASQLESLSQEFFDNQKNIIKYRDELYNTVIAASNAYGDSMVKQVDNAHSKLEEFMKLRERGSLIATGYFSTPILPSVSKDKVQQQRDENNRLIAEEQRYQDEITKIRKRANEMQKADKDQERAEKRADYAQQLADAKKDYNQGVKGTNKTSSSVLSTSKSTDDVSANVNNEKSSKIDVTTEIIDTIKSSDFINSLSGALSDSFKKAFGQSGTSVHDAIMSLLLQNSIWEELPESLTTKLSEVLGVTKSTWDSWITQPENALQAVSLARDNNIGSWDLLRDEVKQFLADTGVYGLSAWNDFINSNPLQAFALAMASWDSMRDLVQQYMNDTIQIVQNGADAITNTQINAPGITEDSWSNLQILIANKIQEVLNVINDTFGNAAVDLNFNVGLNGNPESNPQGIGGNGIVSSARSGIGTPYVWGGESSNGWDCSGFVINRFATQGITIGARTTQEQWANDQGQRITDQSQLQPGDCLYFADSSGDVHHVAIYAGNGSMIHAKGKNYGTIEENFSNNSYYQGQFIGAKRYYSTGTTNAVGGQSLVGDEYLTKGTTSPTPELILSPTSRRAYLAGTHGAEMLNLHSGDVVVPYNETKKLLSDGTLTPLGNMGAFAKGTKGFTNKLSSLFGKKKNQNNQNNNSTSNNNSSLSNAQSQQPTGTRIDIPDGLGYVTTYMHWTSITSPDSLQYKLRQDSGTHYTGDFATINGRNVVALTDTFGWVGDYVDLYLSDGRVVNGIIGDIKDQTPAHGTPANHWGHYDGKNVLEFVMRPGYTGENPSLGGARVAYVVNLGNYWNNPTFAGSTFNSGTNLLAQRLKEVYDRIQSIMGTFKTDTHTTSLKVAPYKSLGTTRGSYGFDVPFTKRETGGWAPAKTIVQTNENGQEATIDSNGNIIPIGDGTPQVIVSDHNFPVINAKDYADIKKYGGDRTPVQFLAKGNTNTSAQRQEIKERLEAMNLEDPIVPQAIDQIAKMENGETIGAYIGVIEPHVGSTELATKLYRCDEEQLKALKELVQYMGEDELITQENFEDYLKYSNDVYPLLKDFTENGLEETLNEYDAIYQQSYAEQNKFEQKFQAEFRTKFDEYAKHVTDKNWWLEYSKLAKEASEHDNNSAGTLAQMEIAAAKGKIEELQKHYNLMVEAAEKAPTATLQMNMLQAAQERLKDMQDIDDKYRSAMENWTNIQLSIVTERDNKFLNALSFLRSDIQDLQESIEKATSASEKVQQYSDINKNIETQIKILQQQKDAAHESNQAFYNSEDADTRWLLNNIKFDEIFDADNNFNNYYTEQIKMLNSYGQINLTERFIQMATIMQKNKQTWVDADKSIKELNQTLEDNNREIKNQKVDTYVSLLERKSQILDYVYEKQQLLIDAESTTNEILQNLRDQRRDYTAELRANKDLGQWLDADTRALLFNEDDYSEMMSKMDTLQSEILSNQMWYKDEISKLDENDLYHQELITEQYTKRNEQLQEELETAQQNLDVAKKTAEYRNIAKERDTQIIMGNRMVNVANPESLYNAALEKTKAETLLSDTLQNHAENQAVRDKEVDNAKIKDESNSYQARIDMINNMTDAEREAIAKFIEPIEELEAKLKSIWKTDLNWIINGINSLDDNTTDLIYNNLGNGYDSSYDYQKAKQMVDKMPLSGDDKEILTKMLDRDHGIKDAGYAKNKYTADTTYKEHILESSTPTEYDNSIYDEKPASPINYKSMETDYGQILQEIADNITENHGIYTLDYDRELIETLANRKLVFEGKEAEQTHNYGGLVFQDEQDDYDAALAKYKAMQQVINDGGYQSEREKQMLKAWANNREITKAEVRNSEKDKININNDLLQDSIDAYKYSTEVVGENTEAIQNLTQNLKVLVDKEGSWFAGYYKKSDTAKIASGDFNKSRYLTGAPKLALGNFKAYAKGTQSAEPGIANVDEHGFEYKLRKVNGDKYIPLNEGDVVFPFKATENLWKISTNPQNWIDGQLRSLGFVGNTSNINSVANNTSSKNTSYNIAGDIIVNEASNVGDIIQGMTDIIATQSQNHSNMEV